VVATRHGGIVDGVLDGQTGRLVAERNVGQLADAILDILHEFDSCVAMGAAARTFVVENFDITNQARKVEALYGQSA
jgi:colanic acid/amylovoran biosynthesis glycosyltransferase